MNKWNNHCMHRWDKEVLRFGALLQQWYSSMLYTKSCRSEIHEISSLIEIKHIEEFRICSLDSYSCSWLWSSQYFDTVVIITKNQFAKLLWVNGWTFRSDWFYFSSIFRASPCTSAVSVCKGHCCHDLVILSENRHLPFIEYTVVILLKLLHGKYSCY